MVGTQNTNHAIPQTPHVPGKWGWGLLYSTCDFSGHLLDAHLASSGTCFALSIFLWELKMLRYRASPVLAPLVYGWCHV